MALQLLTDVGALLGTLLVVTLAFADLARESYKSKNRRLWGVRNMRQAQTPAEWLSLSVSTLPRRKYRLVVYGRYVGVRKFSRVYSMAERNLLERKFGFYGVASVPKVRPTLVIREEKD